MRTRCILAREPTKAGIDAVNKSTSDSVHAIALRQDLLRAL